MIKNKIINDKYYNCENLVYNIIKIQYMNYNILRFNSHTFVSYSN